MSSSQQDDYYTVAQAAKVLDVSPLTIWRWIEANKLPAYRLGLRKIRIKKEALTTIITPARGKAVKIDQESAISTAVPQEELARRQTLVARILEKSLERGIAPLTTAELVRKAREKEYRSYASR